MYCFTAEQVPQYRTGKMAVPNLVDEEFSPGMGEVKFLTELIIFTDIPRSLLLHVLFHDVPIRNNLVPNVFS